MSIRINVINDSAKKFLPKSKIEKAVGKAFKSEKVKKADILIVLCDDIYIRELNKKYLKHDFPTDVLAFTLGEDTIEGEIYVSYERAKEQAEEYKVSLTNELLRLAVHGALHLVGYDDKTKKQKELMFQLESSYISG